MPGVRDFVRIFAPRRGEIVVDAAALDLAPPSVGATSRDRRRRADGPLPQSRRRLATAETPTAPTDPDPEAADQPGGLSRA